MSKRLKGKSDFEQWAIDLAKSKNNSISKQIQAVLTDAAEKMAKEVNNEIASYYQSYDPVKYKRTYNFMNSVRVDKPRQGADGFWSVRIYFDRDLATHPSLFKGEPGFVPILINEGWRWRKSDRPYMLAYYEGFNFIEKAINKYISKYGKSSDLKITKVIIRNGQIVGGQSWL